MKHMIAMVLVFFPALALHAADWQSRLSTGEAVAVDPNTNRATVTRDGVTTPLWAGTHRMQDGSILIIRRGVAIPNQQMMESRQLPAPEPGDWEGIQIVGYSPCEKLVRSVCGKKDQCENTPACDPARQLQVMEREERDTSNNPNLMTYTSGQCLSATEDKEFFTTCRTAPASARD